MGCRSFGHNACVQNKKARENGGSTKSSLLYQEAKFSEEIYIGYTVHWPELGHMAIPCSEQSWTHCYSKQNGGFVRKIEVGTRNWVHN